MDARRARAQLPSAALASAGLVLCAAVPILLMAVPRAGARPAVKQPSSADAAWNPSGLPGGLPVRARPLDAAASAAAYGVFTLAVSGAALAAVLALAAARATLAVAGATLEQVQPRPPPGPSRRQARGGQTMEDVDQESAVDLDGSVWSVLANTDDYIERDRRSRRPVFGYADWKRHRSTNRFTRNLASMPVSTTIRANWKEVLSASTVAVALCFWNDAETVASALNLGPEAINFAQNLPDLSLPALPFTVSSASLSLLLVLRTNKAYERWWEARCIWGAIINTCRDIVRQSLVRMGPRDMALKEEVTRLVSAYPRSLIYHLGERTEISDVVIEKKYRKVLTDEETERLLKCTHKPMTLTGMLSDAIHRAKLPVIDEMKIDQEITKFSDYYGMCERIFKTPMPVSFTRLTSRFLSIWILALPLALYGAITPHWMIVPVTAVIAFFVFGIEEIGLQIEEPFSALAQNAMADGIDASIFEALELEKQDPYTPELLPGGRTTANARSTEVGVGVGSLPGWAQGSSKSSAADTTALEDAVEEQALRAGVLQLEAAAPGRRAAGPRRWALDPEAHFAQRRRDLVLPVAVSMSAAVGGWADGNSAAEKPSAVGEPRPAATMPLVRRYGSDSDQVLRHMRISVGLEREAANRVQWNKHLMDEIAAWQALYGTERVVRGMKSFAFLEKLIEDVASSEFREPFPRQQQAAILERVACCRELVAQGL